MESHRVSESFTSSDKIMCGFGRIRIKKGVKNDKPKFSIWLYSNHILSCKGLSCELYSLATQTTIHGPATSMSPGSLNLDPRPTESESEFLTDTQVILCTVKGDK